MKIDNNATEPERRAALSRFMVERGYYDWIKVATGPYIEAVRAVLDTGFPYEDCDPALLQELEACERRLLRCTVSCTKLWRKAKLPLPALSEHYPRYGCLVSAQEMYWRSRLELRQAALAFDATRPRFADHSEAVECLILAASLDRSARRRYHGPVRRLFQLGHALRRLVGQCQAARPADSYSSRRCAPRRHHTAGTPIYG